jgi:hypothetical protein
LPHGFPLKPNAHLVVANPSAIQVKAPMVLQSKCIHDADGVLFDRDSRAAQFYISNGQMTAMPAAAQVKPLVGLPQMRSGRTVREDGRQ